MAVDPEVVSKFLREQQENTPDELQQSFLNVEEYWDRKLWHELTDELERYFRNPASTHQRLALFDKFIVTFAEKINRLKFVSLGLAAVTQCSGMPFGHDDEFH
jgi:26S proteasome regulatory subunit N9